MSQRGIFEKIPNSGEWWIRYADTSGHIRREKAGTWSAARDLYHKRKTEVLQGRKLPEKMRRAPATFAELADGAVKHIEGRYARPDDDVARLKVIKGWFAGRAANDIKPGEIETALAQAAQEKGWSASTRNHYHNLICLCYRLALRDSKVETSPVHRKVRKLSENNDRVRFLTAAEEKKLREAIRKNQAWASHEPELDLALHTGLRRGSMYEDLIWENVDLRERTAKIPRTKNGEMIVVPLNDDAIRALRTFRSRGDGTGRVVRNVEGTPLKWPKIWFAPAVRAAGIKDFRWHDLRHTYASRLRQTGTPLGNIAELLGHKGLAMTKRYAHLSISNLHEAVARISTDTRTSTEQIAETQTPGFVN